MTTPNTPPENKFSIRYENGQLDIAAKFGLKPAWEFTQKVVLPALIGSGIITGFASLGSGRFDRLPDTSSNPTRIEQTRP